MSSEWEVVVRGGKHKLKSQLTYKDKKKLEDNNLGNNKFHIPYSTDENGNRSHTSKDSNTNSKNKSKRKDSKDDTMKSLNNLTHTDIEKYYNELKSRLPSQPAIVLLDLGIHLNLLISTDNLTNYYDRPDFPIGYLNKPAFGVLKKIFSELPKTVIANFIKSAMGMLENNSDGNTLGLRLLLQMCLRTRPNILLSNRKDFLEMFNTNRDNTVKFKLFVWVIKQACINYSFGVYIWLIYLFPFITQKCHTETVIQFIEQIKYCPTEVIEAETPISVTDFIPFTDLIYSDKSDSTTKKQSKRKQGTSIINDAYLLRLKAIYPKIKDVAFLAKFSSTVKEYFPALFVRLTCDPVQTALNDELLDCLDRCLSASPEASNQLRYLHVEYPNQTEIFLEHIKSNRCSVKGINKSQLLKNIAKEIYKSTVAASKGSSKSRMNLLKNSTSKSSYCTGFFWLLTYTVLFGLIGLMIVRKYPNEFEQMKVVLKPYYDKVMEKTQPFVDYLTKEVYKFYKYCSPYIKTGCDYVGNKIKEMHTYVEPYLRLVMKKIDVLGEYIYNKLNEFAPIVLDNIAHMMDAVYHYYLIGMVKLAEYWNSSEMKIVIKDKFEYLSGVVTFYTDYSVKLCRQWLGY